MLKVIRKLFRRSRAASPAANAFYATQLMDDTPSRQQEVEQILGRIEGIWASLSMNEQQDRSTAQQVLAQGNALSFNEEVFGAALQRQPSLPA